MDPNSHQLPPPPPPPAGWPHGPSQPARTAEPASGPQQPSSAASSESNARIIYVLYLVSLVVGVTLIIGVIMAYVNQASAPAALRTHYRYIIRTFWIGLLYVLLGSVLLAVAVGLVVLPLVGVWFVVRCVKGLKLLGERQPIPNPTTWLW
jgi:uncharacterized membrane protein